jgi:preprotein translocase subunit SecG
MWPTIAKIALVTLLALAVVVIVAVFIRNSRSRGFPTRESSSHFDQAKGAMPPMPTPDWAQDAEPDDTR